MAITSTGRYFEDYSVGQRFRHRRGHTISESDNQLLSLLTMNTAQTHFNRESMKSYMGGQFSEPLLNACVALALAVGLSSQDLAENAIAETSITDFTMPAPVFVGDTLYVVSEIVDLGPATGRPDAGSMSYRLRALKNVEGATTQTVLEASRTVLVKRRHHWQDRDAEFDARRRPTEDIWRKTLT